MLIYAEQNGSNVETDSNAKNNGAAIFIGRITNYLCELIVLLLFPRSRVTYTVSRLTIRTEIRISCEVTNAPTLRTAPRLAGWGGMKVKENQRWQGRFSVVSQFVHFDAVQ